MTLKEFVLNAPDQDDKDINFVLDFLKSQKDLPDDLEAISKAIYRALNTAQTTAFQKIAMMYFYISNNYQQPQDPKFLDRINFIIDLQNEDDNYPYR